MKCLSHNFFFLQYPVDMVSASSGICIAEKKKNLKSAHFTHLICGETFSLQLNNYKIISLVLILQEVCQHQGVNLSLSLPISFVFKNNFLDFTLDSCFSFKYSDLSFKKCLYSETPIIFKFELRSPPYYCLTF